MHLLYEYSCDYTLKWLVEVWYLDQKDIDSILLYWSTKEEIVKAVKEILFED